MTKFTAFCILHFAWMESQAQKVPGTVLAWPSMSRVWTGEIAWYLTIRTNPAARKNYDGKWMRMVPV